MTCVVYSKGVMAADGRETYKDIITSDTSKKIHRLPDGALLGIAGSSAGAARMLNAVQKATKTDRVLPDVSFKGVEAIFVAPSGGVWMYENCTWQKIKKSYVAVIGSGYTVAATALEYGATAKEAVKAACRRISSCGGRILTLKVK